VTNELALCRDFIDAHSHDAARAIERLAASDAAALLAVLPRPTAARALDAMLPPLGAGCLALLDPHVAAAILVELRAGPAASLLRYLGDTARAAVLDRMPADEARTLRTVLTHPPGSAGAVMDSRVFAARESQRIAAVLAALRRLPGRTHDDIFVVDDERRLIGVVRLRDLVAARPAEAVSAVMNRSVSRVPIAATRAAILNHPGWRRCHVLPVVDDGSVLVGAIAHETMRALSEEDALSRPAGLDAAATVFALGELYWLGLSGVLDGVVSAVRGTASREPEMPHGAR
jgi:magnesium transporter